MAFPTTVDTIVDAPPFSANTLGHASQVLGPQRVTVGPVWLNVKSDQIGAKGDGATDDTSAIQSGLTTLRTGGGGILYFPPGTYLVSSSVHPNDATFNACLVVGAKTMLLGAGRDVSVIKMANSQAGANNFMLANFNVLAGGDEQITFQDFSVDGNAANQSPTGFNEGIGIRRARGVRFTRVRSFNNWGTDVGAHEGANFSVDYSTDISYTDCESPSTAAATSLGFSANYCTGVKYENCVSFGSGHGNGFSHFFCRNVQHANCHSYLNANVGFNSEQSDGVVHLGSIAGGQAATISSGNPNYPYASNLSLGNTSHGFVVNQSTQGVRVRLVGCVSRNNGGNGVALTSTTGIRILDGDFSNNGGWGIQYNSASDTDVRLLGSIQATGNTSGAIRVETIGVSFNPLGQIPSPTVPASGTAFTAPYGVDATVYITTGASTCAVVMGGSSTLVTIAATSIGTFRVPSGQTITLTYANAPTWNWMAD